jgi:ankyrin repeat protein
MLLKEEDIDVNIKNVQGFCALTLATVGGYTEIVKCLLEVKGINPFIKNSKNHDAIALACFKGEVEILKMLIDLPNVKFNEVDLDGDSPLMLSCQCGHDECVRILLDLYNNNKILFDPFLKKSVMEQIRTRNPRSYGSKTHYESTNRKVGKGS